MVTNEESIARKNFLNMKTFEFNLAFSVYTCNISNVDSHEKALKFNFHFISKSRFD